MLGSLKKVSFRTWLTIGTLVLLALVIIFGWHEIVRAFRLLGRVDLWILSLLIPVQLFSYYATGGMIFSYLRSKGELKGTGHWAITRMALELNFVNHILPSGGAAGFSYLAWVLSRFGVSAGRATIAQLIRFVLTFVSFVMLLIIAVILVALDHGVSRFILLISSGLVVAVIFGLFFLVYVIGSEARLQSFARWLTITINRLVRKVTFGRVSKALKIAVLEKFFHELHGDFVQLKREKRILVRPFIWAVLANIADVALLWVTFAALGSMVNPAVLLIGFGVSSIAAAVSITPGGTGVYEAIMIAFLASSGVSADVAIAGTLLTRVILLLGTIGFGYVFYQATLIKYGKKASEFTKKLDDTQKSDANKSDANKSDASKPKADKA